MRALCQSMTEVKDWKEQVDHVRNCRAWSHVHVAEADLGSMQQKLDARIPQARQMVWCLLRVMRSCVQTCCFDCRMYMPQMTHS